MEISQAEKAPNFRTADAKKIREPCRLSRMVERVRNVLDIPSTFTYHTQAFATGLTDAEEIFLRRAAKVRSMLS